VCEPANLATPCLPSVAPALAPVASLVLAGCPACRLPLGLDGAPGLAEALATHQRQCPKQRPADNVCPRCGCEAELILRASGWRCGDCLAETRLTDPAIRAAGRSRIRRSLRMVPTEAAQRIGHTARQRRQPVAADQAVVAGTALASTSARLPPQPNPARSPKEPSHDCAW
jgi:hypothetical protein